MSWPVLLTSLTAALEADREVIATVLRGGRAEVFERPTVLVSRRGGQPRQATDWVGGAERFWLECWHYNTTPETADTDLEALESAVQACVHAWLDSAPVAGLVVTGEVIDITADEDTFRPSVGSRMALDLAWRLAP